MLHLIGPSELNSPLWVFVYYGALEQDPVWVYPNFWLSWSDGHVYQIWFFYHNLHYFGDIMR